MSKLTTEVLSNTLQYGGITARVVMMTPELALELLSVNKRNRKLARSKVEDHVLALRKGDWIFNGDAVRVSTEGDLLDGQHRLTAIVKSGVAVPVLVVYGLQPTTQDTMDIGKVRSMGDTLGFRDEKNANDLAASLRFLYRYRMYKTMTPFSGPEPSKADMLRLLDTEPDLREYLRVGSRMHAGAFIPKSVGSACAYLLSRSPYPDEGEDYCESVATGENLGSHDPAFALRRIVLARRTNNLKSPPHHTAALFIKGFNKYVMHEPVAQLKWPAKERFPVVIGS